MEVNTEKTPSSKKVPDSRDMPLSAEAASKLKQGLESAKRGEISVWGDFTQYIEEE